MSTLRRPHVRLFEGGKLTKQVVGARPRQAIESELGLTRFRVGHGEVILGACNPTFAHRALELDESVSLLLPCNVVLADTGNGTKISAVDPRELMAGVAFQRWQLIPPMPSLRHLQPYRPPRKSSLGLR